MSAARTARKREPHFDFGALIVLLGTLPLAAIGGFYLAGYAVPRPLVAAVLALCLLCLMVASVIGFSRRSKESRR